MSIGYIIKLKCNIQEKSQKENVTREKRAYQGSESEVGDRFYVLIRDK